MCHLVLRFKPAYIVSRLKKSKQRSLGILLKHFQINVEFATYDSFSCAEGEVQPVSRLCELFPASDDDVLGIDEQEESLATSGWQRNIAKANLY